ADVDGGSTEVSASAKAASPRQEDEPNGDYGGTEVEMQATPDDKDHANLEPAEKEVWASTEEDGQGLHEQCLKMKQPSQRRFRYNPKPRILPDARRQKDSA
ncbi:unnamed protein product, partial [Ixodes persulcatus]